MGSQVDWLDLEEKTLRRYDREKLPKHSDHDSGRSVYTLREVLRHKKRR